MKLISCDELKSKEEAGYPLECEIAGKGISP
jgi:hypothetical protein